MTNYGHPHCYARVLHDCSAKLSREHYMSASVLKLLGEGHVISNASWLRLGHRSNPLPVNALSSKVLCERHNAALSGLDKCGEAFCREVLRALSIQSKLGPKRTADVDGDGLERWVLKALCGAMASGSLIEDGIQIAKEPPQKWLGILFYNEPWDDKTGLHILEAPLTPHQGYAIGPVYFDDAWIGGGIEFAGVEFFVLSDSGTGRQIQERSKKMPVSLIYRPGAIRFESRSQTTEVRLRWCKRIPVQGVRYHQV